MAARGRSRSPRNATSGSFLPWAAGVPGNMPTMEELAGMAARMAGQNHLGQDSSSVPTGPTGMLTAPVGQQMPVSVASSSAGQASNPLLQSALFPSVSTSSVPFGLPGALGIPAGSPSAAMSGQNFKPGILEMVTQNMMLNQQMLTMMGSDHQVSEAPQQPQASALPSSALLEAFMMQQAGAAFGMPTDVSGADLLQASAGLQASAQLYQAAALQQIPPHLSAPPMPRGPGLAPSGGPVYERIFFIAVPMGPYMRYLEPTLNGIRDRHGEAATAGVRWADLETAHIQLRSLGSLTDSAVETLRQKLALVKTGFAPFKIQLNGGAAIYPDRARSQKIPESLILEVDHGLSILEKLKNAVESTCAVCGLRRDSKAWKPHVRLAHVFDPLRCEQVHLFRLVGAIEALRLTEPLTVPVSELHLVQSNKQPRNDERNAVYNPVATWTLEG